MERTESANRLVPEVRAEPMDGRRLVKGNAEVCRTYRAPSRPWGAPAPIRIRVVFMLVVITCDKEPDALVALVRLMAAWENRAPGDAT